MENDKEPNADELRDEYDLASLSGGVRGKYLERARAGSNVVLLDPDVAQAFPTPQAVNDALRMLVQVAETNAGRSSDR